MLTFILIFADMHNYVDFSPDIWYLWTILLDLGVLGTAGRR